MASITMADARAAVPDMMGEVAIGGLAAPVEVMRDAWGVPHIRARGADDVFIALGFVHAQDRLWQMDATRRRGLGRWAEWVGPSAVAADRLARQLDGEGAAKRDYAALPAEARGMLEAYAAGVNAFIARGLFPVEYKLLDQAPEPWRPQDAIAAMRQRGFLMGSVWFKLWRAAALRTIGPDQIAKLRYDDGGRELLCIPPGAEAQRWIATLQDLAPAIEAVAALGAPDSTGGGSNNWALAPARTAAGRPLLAGDPHRQFELPSMYAQTHIACDAFDALGFTVPGVPGFPHFGHNGHVAWCVTHAFADIHDVFVERFEDNAGRYAFKGEWRPTTRRSETIAVRGAAPVTVDVVATHHGPVIAGDPAKGAALSLRSVQYAETDLSLACLLPMLKAKDVDSFYDAARGWGLIDHNVVAADTKGHIGHLVRAIVPVRPRINGWLPVPGWTGAHEWQGNVPFERMPRIVDPEGGAIVTANNRVVADDHPDYLVTDCHPPYRARRIMDRLDALPAASLPDMLSIHLDDLSLPGLEIRDRIAGASPKTPAGIALRDQIAAWDGHMAPRSQAAAYYIDVRRALTRLLADRSGLARAAADPLTRVPPGVVPLIQLWWTLPALLRADDSALLGGATWPDLIAAALDEVAASGASAAEWGKRHRPKFVHPLSPMFPDAAALLDPSGIDVGGDGDTVWANGTLASAGVDAAYGAIARYAYDVGAWETGSWLVFHGASGHPGSPHYADQVPLWARGALIPALYAWPRIEALARTKQVLKP
ncbi:MAG: penicillin acylase family protein [Reyranellaceae bacterium]